MKKSLKITLSILGSLLIIIILFITIIFIRISIKSKNINNDYESIYQNSLYKEKVEVKNVSIKKQTVSCGYATIEMFSNFDRIENNSKIIITEESLFKEYNCVVTSTGNKFEEEMNKKYSNYYITTKYSYLKNDEMIDKIYYSLKNNMPVPFEWAALLNNEWTLHYSLITGLDIENDNITIANPYGYIENIKIKEFLVRTRFDSFTNMPLLYKFGIAFDMFEKNTIFIIEKK